MDVDFAALFKQGGVALVALALLGYIIKRIGERMISAIDRLTERSDANQKAYSDNLTLFTTTITSSINSSTKGTIDALGHLAERVARIEGRIEAGGAMDEELTPVEVPIPTAPGGISSVAKKRTPAQGTSAIVEYGPTRPPRPKTGG